MVFSLHAVIVRHDLVAKPEIKSFLVSLLPVSAIAFPAILTNTATPIGNAIVTSNIAQFGESFVAGYAVIGRIMPVSFALIFSLSGAIGPIIGQNFGGRALGSDHSVFTRCHVVCFVLLHIGRRHFVVSAR